MARTDTLPHFLTDVADAIRTKTGESDTIQASGFDTAISNIPTGGGADLSDYFNENIAAGTSTTAGFITALKKMPPMAVKWSATSLSRAFNGYRGTEIILTGTPTGLTNTSYMFNGCSNVTLIDIRYLEFTNVTNSTNMFSSVPTNCEIIVKDNTAKTWIQTNFSSLTNVKTVEEYEAQE